MSEISQSASNENSGLLFYLFIIYMYQSIEKLFCELIAGWFYLNIRLRYGEGQESEGII